MIVVAGATLVPVTRTYGSLAMLESAFAIWDDRQVVVFVHTGHIGTSTTLVDRLQIRANWYPIKSPVQASGIAGVTTVVRIEDGLVRPATLVLPGIMGYANEDFLPRFAEGKPLVIGGFWNGTEVERIPADDYRALMQSEDSEDQAGRWHSGSLVRWMGSLPPRRAEGAVDLPVSVRGESMTVRSTLGKRRIAIELLRAGKTSTLIDLPLLESKKVSKHEFDAMFNSSRTR
jgi:hypothetical protein